jgi:hypothetical protein
VLKLYLLDAQLASSFHALFRLVEILLRETMHRALTKCFGEQWFQTEDFRLAVDQRVLRTVEQSVSAVHVKSSGSQIGQVVSRIMLGTWVQLLAEGIDGKQDATIWQLALKPFFCHDASLDRSDVFRFAQRVNWARNRVNHCEPVVFGFPLPGQKTASGQTRRLTPLQVLNDTRKLVSTINPHVAAWVNTWNDLDGLANDPLVAAALAFKARDRNVSFEESM